MGQSTEELTRDIEATRRDLSRDVDELSDKVSPRRIMERRKTAAKGRLNTMRERVMGTVSSAGSGLTSTGGAIGDQASQAASSVQDAGQQVVETMESRTEGSPITAGMIAFGAGFLLSSLLPSTKNETKAAGAAVDAAKEHAGPVREQMGSIGQDVGQQLMGSATESAQQVMESAQQSAETLKEEATSSARTVKDEAKPS